MEMAQNASKKWDAWEKWKSIRCPAFRMTIHPQPRLPRPVLRLQALLDLFDEFSHVHRPKQECLKAVALEAALHAQGMAGDDPDGDAFRPDHQTLDIYCRVVTCGYVGDEKRRKDKGPFELREGIINRLIGFHADAFLDQLRSKQRASLPVLSR